MHEHYGIDMATPSLLSTRSARWLRVRIHGLYEVRSRLTASLGGE